MNACGPKTIRSLGRTFNAIASGKCRKVEAQEFFVGLNKSGCVLAKFETNCLLSTFDTDADGCVNYDEFLICLRGCPNKAR